MLDFILMLLVEQKKLVDAIVTEGQQVSKIAVRASFDSWNSAGRAVAAVTSPQRYAWLKSSGLPPETKAKVKVLPLEEESLFRTRTGKILEKSKETRCSAISLGIYQPPERRPGVFRYQRQHSFLSAFPTQRRHYYQLQYRQQSQQRRINFKPSFKGKPNIFGNYNMKS